MTRAKLTVTRSQLLVDGSDRAFQQAMADLLSFWFGIDSIKSCLARAAGLTNSGFATLIVIQHLQAEGGVNIVDVARQMSLTGSTVTIEVNKLVDSGLVSKRQDKRDRRRVQLSLTPKAWELLDSISGLRQKVNDSALEPLDQDDFRKFCDILHRLAGNIGVARSLAEYLTELKLSEGTENNSTDPIAARSLT